MTSRAGNDRLTWEEAYDALVRGLLVPEALPERVAAAAARAALDPESRAGRQVQAWGADPAGGRGARRVAAVASSAAVGELRAEAAEAVRERYGFPGLLATLGIASLARMSPPIQPPRAAVTVPSPSGGFETGDVLSMVRRSFETVPVVWEALRWDPGALRRWWWVHEAAMAPGALTGPEKWLGMVAICRAAGVTRLGGPYRDLLLESGWDDTELRTALQGRTLKLRRGVGRGIFGAAGLAAGELDPARAWLHAADLEVEAAVELLQLVELAGGLSTYLVLRMDQGSLPQSPGSLAQ